MRQVVIQSGQIKVEDVPAPMVERGSVLVCVHYSCISSGTELKGIAAGATPVWKRALARPQQAAALAKRALSEGAGPTWDKVQDRLQRSVATGYSAAGTVAGVGAEVEGILVGQPVACAGGQCAFHAEVIVVPRHLVAPVPSGVELPVASTVALGAIAMQGVRRAQPTLGETFVVIGLGALGNLTVQLLRANGCHTIGVDPEASRVKVAQECGLEVSLDADTPGQVEHVLRLTHGQGADGVIITASTASDAVVATAFQMCRKKGRVVLVGDVGLHLNRADFYQKEIDFLISTSYGPGRYDASYEEEGKDYPLGYVRWTENRNMAEFLRLAAEKKIHVDPILSKVYPVEEAPAAYAHLREGTPRPTLVLLAYASDRADTSPVERMQGRGIRTGSKSGGIHLAIVGAGSHFQNVHLPNLRLLRDLFEVQAVVCRHGHNASAVARQCGASVATTQFEAVLEDDAVDAVLIATRHNLHADMALRALQAGKHVLVEKPLALTRAELVRIEEFFAKAGTDTPLLVTGFNRRFSSHLARARAFLGGRTNPCMISYRMNAGYLPPGHWVHGVEGGGRNRGEACHIYDLMAFLVNGRASSITTSVLEPSTAYYGRGDNFVATLEFDEGSVASLTYTALGCSLFAKESMEVYAEGKVLSLDDYEETRVFVGGGKPRGWREADKGQRALLRAFGEAIRFRHEWPIPLWQQVEATRIAIEVQEQIEQREGA